MVLCTCLYSRNCIPAVYFIIVFCSSACFCLYLFSVKFRVWCDPNETATQCWSDGRFSLLVRLSAEEAKSLGYTPVPLGAQGLSWVQTSSSRWAVWGPEADQNLRWETQGNAGKRSQPPSSLALWLSPPDSARGPPQTISFASSARKE